VVRSGGEKEALEVHILEPTLDLAETLEWEPHSLCFDQLSQVISTAKTLKALC
jgi:hypothetical protein